VSSQYGVGGLPTTILIDRRGRVVGGALGGLGERRRQALIHSLLEQR
jgi:hypothetical protein